MNSKAITGQVWREEPAYLRGLAIILVMLTHVMAQSAEHISWPNSLLVVNLFFQKLSSGFSTFIFVSGFVLANKYTAWSSWFQFYLKRLKMVLPPYILFTAVYIFFDSHKELDWKSLLGGVLRGDSASHMWFFLSIIQLYLLFPIINDLYSKFVAKNRDRNLLAGVFIFFIVWRTIIQIFYSFGPAQGENAFFSVFMHFAEARLFINGLTAFMLGMYASAHFEKFKSWLIKLPTALILFFPVFLSAVATALHLLIFKNKDIAAPFWITYTMDLLTTLLHLALIGLHFRFVFFLLNRPKSIMSICVSSFSRYSYGIFLVHLLFQIHLQKRFVGAGIGYESVFFYPLLFFCTSALSYVFINLLSKVPYSEWVIGVRRKKTGRSIVQ